MESDSQSPNETEIDRSNGIKNFLARLFAREEETLREQLQRFFDDQELRINNDQLQMIEGVLSLVDKRAENIKVPSPRMVSLPVTINRADLENILRKSGHTRFPVYTDKDGLRDYVGILHVKDLLPFLMKGGKKIVLKDIVRKLLVVPENQTLLSLMRTMRQKKFHMALTVNEHGDVSGLVTLEDILEEIVGDILDEHDNRSNDIKEIGLRIYRVDAMLPLNEVNQRIALNLPEEKFNTLAGFLLHQLKGDVAENREIRYGSVNFRLEKVSGQQIKNVIVELDVPSANAGNNTATS
ncbi:MAG: CBS domain-containing protein [Leptospiraceae bacterium]|nr:CBS domain-containing protein [Leptospiraceae bacterium]